MINVKIFVCAGSMLLMLIPQVGFSSGRLYTLTKLDVVTIDERNAGYQMGAGVSVGLQIKDAYYVESEFNLPVSGGEYGDTANKGEIRLSMFALYAVFRHFVDPSYYLKVKAGAVYEQVERTNIIGYDQATTSGSGASGGVGLGYVYHGNKNPVMLELEVTSIDQGAVLYSLGMTYPF